MLEYIKIKNFEKHKKFYEEFSDGVTVFIGSSDRGKSSIIRAILWLFYNRPLGDSFRTYDTKETSVEIGIDSNIIRRVKTNSKNFYELNGKILEANNKSVPDEITSLLNISDINIQKQMDAPFLLSNTGGEVGRYINTIISLDVMDKALSNALSDNKRINKEIKFNEKEQERVENDLKEFNWLNEAEDKLEKLEKMNEECVGYISIIAEIEKIREEIIEIENELEETKDIIRVSDIVETLLNGLRIIEKEEAYYNELYDLVEEVEGLTFELAETENVDEISEYINNLLLESSEIDGIKKEYNELNTCKNTILNTEKEIKSLDKEIVNIENKFNELMPEVCPLCGQEIK